MACRPPSGEPAEALLNELVADPATHIVRPRPLGAAAVARLLLETLGRPADPEFTEACLAAK